MRPGLSLGLLALVLSPAALQAQDCEAIHLSSFNITNQGLPNEVTYIQDAEIACPGGKRLVADQAIMVAAAGRIELIGHVSYRDAERSLTAQRAEYYKQQEYIHATGSVVIRDLKTGSTIYNDEINYYQAGRTRSEALLEALPSTAQPPVRPRAVLRDEEKGSQDSTAGRLRRARRDSTVVVADMIQVMGQRHFRGLGSAVITKDSVTAYGGIADYDQDTGELELAGQGRVEGTSYQLRGDTVKAQIEQDTLREITARRNGKLTTSDITVEAPRIRIELAAGEVEKMTAVRPAADTAEQATRPPQPSIVARQFRLAADSIDVLAPGQQLDEVLAVGDAYSSTNDTIPAPPDAGELEAALSSDWMRGDTVHAYFVANPKADTDTTADKRVLDRVVATGSPASSLYRKREEVAATPAAATGEAQDSVTAGPPPAAAPPPPEYSIGYLLARRIEVTMADGEVQDVNASQDVRGIYLQPNSRSSNQAAARSTQVP